MRTGTFWGIAGYGVVPDIIVSAKGIGGGLYPLGVVMLSERTAGWLEEDGWAHMSTGGGGELGCVVALKVLEITRRSSVAANVERATKSFADGLADIRSRYSDFFIGIRQNGLIMGLEFSDPDGAKFVSRALYENGVWAIFCSLDPHVLQFKPGLLVSDELCAEVLDRFERALPRAKALMVAAKRAA
jgi:acetylornithine/succinyldiaminopimelate/putrescine aminotransferase